jgi:8-oxo-dGTP pyrophosphatase MutT (NUDIX family)
MADFVIPFDQLPERFAQSILDPPEVPATPRPAATIALMRDGADGPEILLLRRSRSSGFVPGAYVFPGGRVDADDAEAHIVQHLRGLDAEQAARRLGLPDTDPPALAYYLAALREAFEETGILVARRSDGSPPPSAAEDAALDGLRNDLMDDRVGFAEVLDRAECTLDGGAVEYLAHWITPEPEPRRYDTRFFAAKVPSGAQAIIDSREMTDAVWVTAAESLRQYRAGTLPMVFPTVLTLRDLIPFGSVDAILADLRTRDIPTILPRLVLTPEGIGTELDR